MWAQRHRRNVDCGTARPSRAFLPSQESGRSSDGEQTSGSGQAQAERVRDELGGRRKRRKSAAEKERKTHGANKVKERIRDSGINLG